MRKLPNYIGSETGIGSAGVIAATVPALVLGTRIVRGGSLPATGVAFGIYGVIAIALLGVGLLARWAAARRQSRTG